MSAAKRGGFRAVAGLVPAIFFCADGMSRAVENHRDGAQGSVSLRSNPPCEAGRKEAEQGVNNTLIILARTRGTGQPCLPPPALPEAARRGVGLVHPRDARAVSRTGSAFDASTNTNNQGGKR